MIGRRTWWCRLAIGCAIVCGVGVVMEGCEKPPTLPPLRPGWKEIARFKYNPETLAQHTRDGGFGTLADEVAEGKDPVEGRYAEKDSLEITDDPNDPIDRLWYPQNKMIDVEIPTKNQGAAWCKFRVIMGPNIGTPEGKGKKVDADGEPHADKGEPIYAAEEGFIVVGGHIPVARGRRSRAGAPGTIIAVWVVRGANNEYIDRWFIVNWKGSHKLDVAPGTSGSADSTRITFDADKDTTVKYIEVSNNETLSVKSFEKSDTSNEVYKFWNEMQKIAKQTKLDNVKW